MGNEAKEMMEADLLAELEGHLKTVQQALEGAAVKITEQAALIASQAEEIERLRAEWAHEKGRADMHARQMVNQNNRLAATEARALTAEAALAKAGDAGVVAGWVRAPAEPTEAMMEAGSAYHGGSRKGYRAMLAAAPTPPAPDAPAGMVEDVHGPFGYLVGHIELDESEWRIEQEPTTEEGYFCLPMFTKEDPFALMVSDDALASSTDAKDGAEVTGKE